MQPITTTTTNAAHPAAPWEWVLAAGQATRLAPAPQPRWLEVTAGMLWLTATQAEGADNPDRWLAPGARLCLRAGTEWVLEGDGDARYALLEAPAAAREPACASTRGLHAMVPRWARRLSFMPAPAVCV